MKRLLTLIALLLAFVLSADAQKRIDTLYNDITAQDSIPFGSLPTTPIPGTEGMFVSAGVHGAWYVDANGKHRLDTIPPGADSAIYATKHDLNLVNAWYGYATDGDITPTADTTLARDMHADDLTLNAGIDINTAGFRIFVADTLLGSSKSEIRDTGVAGVSATNAPTNTINSSVGASGDLGGPTTGKADGYLVRHSTADLGGNGGDGSDGGVRAGTAGVVGSTVTNCIGSAGVAGGGGGGVGGQPGGAGGGGGACTIPTAASGWRRDIMTQYIDRAFAPDFGTFSNAYLPIRFAPGAGGGGGGGRGISGTSGANYCIGGHGPGGSGGQPGGKLWIAAKHIAGTFTVNVKGGKGGGGGRGADATGGVTVNEGGHGGGGGGGGNAGVVMLFYRTISGITINLTGGVAGTGGGAGSGIGPGAAAGTAGNNGTAGNTGLSFLWKL
jgi:hypothetical protein